MNERSELKVTKSLTCRQPCIVSRLFSARTRRHNCSGRYPWLYLTMPALETLQRNRLNGFNLFFSAIWSKMDSAIGPRHESRFDTKSTLSSRIFLFLPPSSELLEKLNLLFIISHDVLLTVDESILTDHFTIHIWLDRAKSFYLKIINKLFFSF